LRILMYCLDEWVEEECVGKLMGFQESVEIGVFLEVALEMP
jgi:hypothetical protein